jgi:YHS domain-containing protein
MNSWQRTMVLSMAVASLSMVAVGCAQSQSESSAPPVDTSKAIAQSNVQYYEQDGLAIGGTDPVAYFTADKPEAGTAEYEYKWQGVTWRFASAENLDLFTQNPEKYAPQYGGFCAFAVSKGSTAPSDPEAWTIVNNKLYLNLNQSVREKWQEDVDGNIAKADANWPGVLKN